MEAKKMETFSDFGKIYYLKKIMSAVKGHMHKTQHVPNNLFIG
jgi:hypothetical protein